MIASNNGLKNGAQLSDTVKRLVEKNPRTRTTGSLDRYASVRNHNPARAVTAKCIAGSVTMKSVEAG